MYDMDKQAAAGGPSFSNLVYSQLVYAADVYVKLYECA